MFASRPLFACLVPLYVTFVYVRLCDRWAGKLEVAQPSSAHSSSSLLSSSAQTVAAKVEAVPQKEHVSSSQNKEGGEKKRKRRASDVDYLMSYHTSKDGLGTTRSSHRKSLLEEAPPPALTHTTVKPTVAPKAKRPLAQVTNNSKKPPVKKETAVAKPKGREQQPVTSKVVQKENVPVRTRRVAESMEDDEEPAPPSALANIFITNSDKEMSPDPIVPLPVDIALSSSSSSDNRPVPSASKPVRQVCV